VFRVVVLLVRRIGKQIRKFIIALLSEDQGDVYQYVVFSEWDVLHSIKDIVHELENFDFIKTMVPMRRGYRHSKMFQGLVPELLYKADSLFVAIAPRRAVLFQKEPQPFTSRDLALRETILTLYPQDSLVGLFSKEPSFETEIISLKQDDRLKILNL
jgi:hypothetical protein